MSESAAVYREFKQRGGVADLSDRLKLRLTGGDRVRYLNGQVTANVAALAAGHALPACVTTAKGRLCAEVFLHAGADALFVDADASLRESLPGRLERYIIADDVTLEDVTDQFHLIHLLGSVAPAADLFDEAAFAGRAQRFRHDGWDLALRPEVFAKLWPQLVARIPVLDAELQEVLRVEAGVPRWGRELTEDTLPPEAGLDDTHIDYHKGCYIGQEVISRLKSVGHVNRELIGFISSAGAPLAPGAVLYPPDGAEKSVGVLTSTAFSFALEKPIALGYLKRGAAFPDLIARSADSTEVLVAAHALPLVP
ncbi:MAG: tRNA-modifying protein YgfZ [Chthoniobacter sp.]|jgi:folate-binding protein YgfZ|nr:tRNA-modifying protein YgfZ [Chthoniobacter sp.]